MRWTETSSSGPVEATIIVGDRIYLFTLYDSGQPIRPQPSQRALFEAIMASVQLTPETAELAPRASP